MIQYNTKYRDKEGNLIEGTTNQNLIVCKERWKLINIYRLIDDQLTKHFYFPLLKGYPYLNREELTFFLLNPDE